MDSAITAVGIPAKQCDTWCDQGATVTSASTYTSIKAALAHQDSAIRGRDYDVYLQGSYKSDTNIRGDSDVDVVVELNETYYQDISDLSADEQTALNKSFIKADYSINAFDADVQSALKSYYGSKSVTAANKCLKVADGGGRLPADVVVAAQFRRYTKFRGYADQHHDQGITFWGRTDKQQVINYPRQHCDNSVSKNKSTKGNYKPSVRMIKNARAYLADNNVINRSLAPSYFVEGWLYNVPDEKFVSDSNTTFYNILKFFEGKEDWTKFVCQNYQYYLFGPLNVQWHEGNARALHKALVKLWNEWD
jgi:hypothetical protein